jgi:hypothetical protein
LLENLTPICTSIEKWPILAVSSSIHLHFDRGVEIDHKPIMAKCFSHVFTQHGASTSCQNNPLAFGKFRDHADFTIPKPILTFYIKYR